MLLPPGWLSGAPGRDWASPPPPATGGARPAIAGAALAAALYGAVLSWIPFFGVLAGLVALGLGIGAIAATSRRKGRGMAWTAASLGAVILVVGLLSSVWVIAGLPWSEPPAVEFRSEPDGSGAGGRIIVVSAARGADWGDFDVRQEGTDCLVPGWGAMRPGDAIVCRAPGPATVYHLPSEDNVYRTSFGTPLAGGV